MPIYEYICSACGKPFSLFLSYADYDTAVVRCPDCGSGSVRRRIRPVRVATGEKARLQKISEEAAGSDSPQMLGKVMRTIQENSGRELPPDTNEALTRLERGESPSEINKDYD